MAHLEVLFEECGELGLVQLFAVVFVEEAEHFVMGEVFNFHLDGKE